MVDFLPVWPWNLIDDPEKIIRHVFYTTSSFVYHFRSISEFKLELQSENAQSGSNSMISWALWPCNLTYDLEKKGHLFYATSSFVHHFVAISDFKLELQSGNAQFGTKLTIFWAVWPWNLTYDLETRQIWGIWKLRPAYSPQTPNLGQISDALYRVTLKFDGWPWKTIGHLSFAVSSLQHFIAISEFKLELLSGNA